MSQKLGKNLNHQESEISLKNHSPGCMWGILHHFHHNKWHNVKKRLPRKTHISPAKHPRTTTDQESSTTTSTTSEAAAHQLEENINNDSSVQNSAVVGTKSVDPPRTTPKSSMKSRIRALITEEMSRRRGRHRRSSSYPIRSNHLESSHPRNNNINNNTNTNTNNKNNNKSNNNNPDEDLYESVHSTASLAPEDGNNNRSCELCDTMLNVKYLKQNEINNKVVRQPIKDQTPVPDKLIYAVEPRSKRDSLQESKLFLDALDLLNMRKEVFLKILQDPTSSLAHQLHFRRTNNSKIGLTKSVSFPVSGSSSLTRKDITKSENTKEEDDGLQSCIEMTEESKKHYESLRLTKNSNPEQFLREMELSENSSSPTSDKNTLEKRHDNKVVLKRFKNLREKLKHVIRDRKKEKNRIIMDAVHHKIPYGSYEDGSCGSNQLGSSDYCNRTSSFKRTSSFNESLDRYNKLIEISLNNKEASKDQVSDRLRFRTADNSNLSPIPTRPASLARILSLPDLRFYSSIQIDDSSCYHTPDVTVHAETSSKGNYISLISEQKSSQENLLDETFDDSDTKTWESASSHDLNIEALPVSSDLQMLKSDHVSENDPFSYTEEDEIICQELDLFESQDGKHDIFHLDIWNKADFNYVKDILELSGFSRDEILGKWYSAEHPVDPMVYDEVEGYEEGGGMNFDHLLLFDLINEVLLDIYERSFCYWPRPLTSRSRMHRMPKGYRVLEEVWGEIRRLMSLRAEIDQAIDDAVSRDLMDGRDGWMNLQLDGECVGLELEDLIFDDLIEEVIWS